MIPTHTRRGLPINRANVDGSRLPDALIAMSQYLHCGGAFSNASNVVATRLGFNEDERRFLEVVRERWGVERLRRLTEPVDVTRFARLVP